MAVDRTFYAQRAADHGGMAAYYLRHLVTGRDSDGNVLNEYSIAWAMERSRDEAREAWHYALLMTPGQVESELKFQADAALADAALALEF